MLRPYSKIALSSVEAQKFWLRGLRFFPYQIFSSKISNLKSQIPGKAKHQLSCSNLLEQKIWGSLAELFTICYKSTKNF
jgi:hypothetical protein